MTAPASTDMASNVVDHSTTRHSVHLGAVPGEADPLDLPVRILSENANLAEYTTETVTGNIIRPEISRLDGKEQDWKLVTFIINDPENPKNWSKAKKWYCTMVVAFTCFVVAFASAVITAGLDGPMKTFHVSMEVSLLQITVFVVGFGVGRLIVLLSFLHPSFTNKRCEFGRSNDFCSLI
jgi:hypothetical protein